MVLPETAVHAWAAVTCCGPEGESSSPPHAASVTQVPTMALQVASDPADELSFMSPPFEYSLWGDLIRHPERAPDCRFTDIAG
jgi:hypothetical protein